MNRLPVGPRLALARGIAGLYDVPVRLIVKAEDLPALDAQPRHRELPPAGDVMSWLDEHVGYARSGPVYTLPAGMSIDAIEANGSFTEAMHEWWRHNRRHVEQWDDRYVHQPTARQQYKQAFCAGGGGDDA